MSIVSQPVNTELVEACPAPAPRQSEGAADPSDVRASLRGVASGHASPGSPLSLSKGQPFEITLTAYAVGREDAQAGELCLPELLYVRPQDVYDYCLGYVSIRPDSILAEQLLSKFEREQYEISRGIEPEYQPSVIDFEVDF